MFPLESTSIQTNPLSIHWRYLAGHRGPNEQNYWNFASLMGDSTVQTMVTSTTIYIMGMVGYAFSLINRIIGVVKDLLVLIVSLLTSIFWALSFGCLFSRAVKNELNPGLRAYVLVGAIAELGSGIIGCVCPPLGYALDERIHTNKTWDHNTCPGSCTQEYVSDISERLIEAKIGHYKNEPLLDILKTELINGKRFFPKVKNNENGRIYVTSLAIIGLMEDERAKKNVFDMNVCLTHNFKLFDEGWAGVAIALSALHPDKEITNDHKRRIVTALLIQKLLDSSFKIEDPIFAKENLGVLEVINTNLIDNLISESKKFLYENGDRAHIYFQEIFRQ